MSLLSHSASGCCNRSSSPELSLEGGDSCADVRSEGGKLYVIFIGGASGGLRLIRKGEDEDEDEDEDEAGLSAVGRGIPIFLAWLLHNPSSTTYLVQPSFLHFIPPPW